MNFSFGGKKHMKGNEKGIVLISFFIIVIILTIGVGAFYVYAYADYAATLRTQYLTQAFYAAEAGIDQKIRQLSTGNMATTLNGSLTATQYSGNYSVNCDPCTMANNEVLTGTGTVIINGTVYSRTVRVTIRRQPLFVPQAGVAANGNVSTLGNITIDGRDHDLNGNVVGAGLPGVSASGIYSQGGSSQTGGNGIAPASPANPGSYITNQPLMPTSPETILGLQPGALDAYKTATPPATPFTNQIVYLTSNWTAPDFNGSSGVLIVHNDAVSATLKNVHGSFKGLIIADDIVHINGDAEVLGAVVVLNQGGATLGNGSAEVLYSSAALANLPITRYTVTSWEDAKNDSVN